MRGIPKWRQIDKTHISGVEYCSAMEPYIFDNNNTYIFYFLVAVIKRHTYFHSFVEDAMKLLSAQKDQSFIIMLGYIFWV